MILTGMPTIILFFVLVLVLVNVDWGSNIVQRTVEPTDFLAFFSLALIAYSAYKNGR